MTYLAITATIIAIIQTIRLYRLIVRHKAAKQALNRVAGERDQLKWEASARQ